MSIAVNTNLACATSSLTRRLEDMQNPTVVPAQGVFVQIPHLVNATGQTIEDHRLKHYKRIMRGLGFAELVIGLISSTLGVALLADAYGVAHYHLDYNDDLTQYPILNFGAGLWCGVMVVISGSLGIASGRKTLTRCLLNSSMASSIFGAIFSAVLFSMAIPMSIVYGFDTPYMFGIGIEATLAVLGFTTMILCIVSASYCCCAAPSLVCCGTCCVKCCGQQYPLNDAQVMYVMTDGVIPEGNNVVQTQPVFVQNPTSSMQQGSGAVTVQYGVTQATQQRQPNKAENTNQAENSIPIESLTHKDRASPPPSYHS